MSSPTQELLGGLVTELAQILSTYGGAPADVGPGQFPHGRRFVATLTGSGAQSGTCVLTIDYAGAQAMATILNEGVAPANDAATASALRGGIEQAAAALSGQMPLTLTSVESGGMGVPDGEMTAYAITLGGGAGVVMVAVSWDARVSVSDSSAVGAPTPGSGRDAQMGRNGDGEERIEDRIDVILDIDLPVVVRFGRTELPIRQLTRLGMGSVIDLGRSPDDPVELLVSGRVVAHGEVVIVGGNYGIRILDVASPSERVRSMEA